ncbi:MAG: deoxyguanosinetriphosphate triphosphohydrolase [Alphaproteobacteria bacterium]|nr:deoxyguanosinetriphosphate triphosphohydrolase [Alphaproteobacteria bacterium]
MTLATYAIDSEKSKGRLYVDFKQINRSAFQRDRDRIIHSSAFRRLDGKTQVFAYHEGENYRTRLTHSIEVAQITRTICKNLNLNEELGEAIALAHDLGHPPFGHAGERGLKNVLNEFGGFDHNVHSLKIVTQLEVHYPQFAGLNLSWEVLEGIVKHNGPINIIYDKYLKEFNQIFDLELNHYPSLEAQVASISDDIAYNNHDIDDGFRAGFFTIEELRQLPFIDRIIINFEKDYPNCDDNVKMYAITRNLISGMVFDILENSKLNLEKFDIKTFEDVQKHGGFLIDFSNDMKEFLKDLKAFLKARFYSHTKVTRMDMKSQKVVEDLFGIFMKDTNLLPAKERNKIAQFDKNEVKIADIIAEYIAEMTDLACLNEHEKLFNLYTRF